MIIDRLYEQVENMGPLCLGLDTDISYIPDKMKKFKSPSDYIFDFNKEIIDSTKDLVPIYKLQIAFYEAMGLEGMMAYCKTMKYLKENDLLSIGDIKRGDISNTGQAYAKGHFQGDFEADFITVSAYMGFDTIDPYMPYLEFGDKGIFVLLRTSNPGAGDLQDIKEDGKYVYEYVGEELEKRGKKLRGKYGYSPLGAVVGGTSPQELKYIRKSFPNTFFLIPGYGAQGASGQDIRNGLIENNGAIINSSRGIICRHFKDSSDQVGMHARQAVKDMRGDLCH